jgi:hypothetical protein
MSATHAFAAFRRLGKLDRSNPVKMGNLAVRLLGRLFVVASTRRGFVSQLALFAEATDLARVNG